MSGRLAPQLTCGSATTGSIQDWREYRNDYRFDHSTRRVTSTRTPPSICQLTHTMSSRAFQTLAVGYFRTERPRGDGFLFDDFEDPRRSTYAINGSAGNPSFDGTEGLFLYGPDDSQGAHIYNNFLHRQSSYIEGKYDYTRQLNSSNLVKVGVDFQDHSLSYFEHLRPTTVYESNAFPYVDVQSYGFDSTGFGDVSGERSTTRSTR